MLARKLGFKNIIECSGDSANMLKQIKKNFKCDEIKGRNIIYAGAKEISFNLPNKLNELGYSKKI